MSNNLLQPVFEATAQVIEKANINVRVVAQTIE